MFESNYPADKQSFSYNVIWNAYKRVARALELTAEQTEVCAGTATRVYSCLEVYAAGYDREEYEVGL